MPKTLRLLFAGLMLLVAAACGSSDEGEVLPTRFASDQGQVTTADADATDAPTNTPTPISGRPTLPPTYTPTPQPTETQQPEADVAAPISVRMPQGTIYFIYNGDSIIALDPQTGQQELIVTFGVDRPVHDLNLSPDGQLLAFVAPGSGSANEVWISNRDGTYLQQISCLGLPEVQLPTWHPDSERVAFFAGPASGGPLDIYETSWVGSNNCPEGNNQRQLLTAASTLLGGLAYDPEGTRLFFSNDAVFALDLNTSATTGPLTRTLGAGSDFALDFPPSGEPLLTYLRDRITAENLPNGGELIALDVSNLAAVESQFEQRVFTTRYDWRSDSGALLMSSEDSVVVLDRQTQIGEALILGTSLRPQAVFGPAGDYAAFVNGTAENPAIPQVFIADLQEGISTQVTTITEGTVDDLSWAPPPQE
ncbi:MAG: TolB family protein [Chloroflexota bacterium]